jgi:hypothetical protein
VILVALGGATFFELIVSEDETLKVLTDVHLVLGLSAPNKMGGL